MGNDVEDLLTEAFRSAVAEAEETIDPSAKLDDFVTSQSGRFWSFDGRPELFRYAGLAAVCAVAVMGGIALIGSLRTESYISANPAAVETGTADFESDPGNAQGQFSSGGGNAGLIEFSSDSDADPAQSTSTTRSKRVTDRRTGPKADDARDANDETGDSQADEDDLGMPSSTDSDDPYPRTTLDDEAATTTQYSTLTAPTFRQTTSRPDVSRPTSSRLTTSRPTTSRLTTSRPTTSRLTTSRPTTSRLTTSRPTTSRLTTSRPTTTRPSTSRPTTTTTTTTSTTTTEPTTTTTASTTSTTEYEDPTCSFSVPSGASIAEAKSIIRAGGCTGSIVVRPSGASGQLGSIIGGYSQSPLVDATITLWAKVTVPSVIGLTQAAASSRLNEAGLSSNAGTIVVQYEDPRIGTVISQSVSPGSSLTYQSVVGFSVAVAGDPNN